MTASPSSAGASARADDHLAAVDAVYRFAAGQDFADAELFESAFADTAVLDFSQPARTFGADAPVMVGRRTIVDVAFPIGSSVVTTHTVTNPRVSVDGDRAELVALVEAQHVDPNDAARHFLLKNVYRVALTREPPGWRIARLDIENVWSTGDPTVLFPDTTHHLEKE